MNFGTARFQAAEIGSRLVQNSCRSTGLGIFPTEILNVCSLTYGRPHDMIVAPQKVNCRVSSIQYCCIAQKTFYRMKYSSNASLWATTYFPLPSELTRTSFDRRWKHDMEIIGHDIKEFVPWSLARILPRSLLIFGFMKVMLIHKLNFTGNVTRELSYLSQIV